MPNYTEKYNLKKPLGTEHYNIEDHNGNMDIIDQELEEQAQQISDLSGEVIATKKSVSDGKSLVATAITQKGVATSNDATFATMAGNIGQIQTESMLSGNAVAGDVLSGKTFYNTNPKSKVTGTLALTGTALAAQVLAGNYFYNTDAKTRILGTMVNRAAQTATLATQGAAYVIPEGYHNGSGKVTASITNLVAANIMAGKTVGGVQGIATNDATAIAIDVASGKTAYVNGSKITGTLVSAVDKSLLNGTDERSVPVKTNGWRYNTSSTNAIFIFINLYRNDFTMTAVDDDIFHKTNAGNWIRLTKGSTYSQNITDSGYFYIYNPLKSNILFSKIVDHLPII